LLLCISVLELLVYSIANTKLIVFGEAVSAMN